MKANHNKEIPFPEIPFVVYQVKDTIFWKQITTASSISFSAASLFIKSKIQFFESKSQPSEPPTEPANSCLSSQRYNFLKANHNSIAVFTSRNLVVYQVKDTIFWKQITTELAEASILDKLFIKSKIQFFESKSQQRDTISRNTFCCLSSQRYNFLKANHNVYPCVDKLNSVVYQVKDTIFWKQITTPYRNKQNLLGLFIKSKIQFFESKSQQYLCHPKNKNSCLSSQRYNFLKANHNWK